MLQVSRSSPFNYAILHDFLTESSSHALQKALLNHWGWQYREISHNWQGRQWKAQQLYNDLLDLPIIGKIVTELISKLSPALSEYELVRYWAIICHRNEGIFPHCDGGKISLNLWLAPEEYILQQSSGGLLLFDVKRLANMLPTTYSSERGGCTKFVEDNTNGNTILIPYRFNTAVLFDAWTFHATDCFSFCKEDTEAFRLNITLLFDRKMKL